MPKLAVITEKDSVARDIVEALKGFEKKDNYYESDRYLVTSAVGHIVGLLDPEEIDPKYKRWTLETLPILPEKFELKPLDGMKSRLKLMEELFKRRDVEGIVNACDAGREGELIFREIVRFTGAEKPVYRLWLQSMTTEAIREGFKNLDPGEKFNGLADAAWSRAESDWLVGMNATRAVSRRLQTKKDNGVWSAGRVQTPTLAILVDHEMKILGFEPRSYWQIVGTFQAADHTYQSTWFDPNFKGDTENSEKDDRIFSEQRAREIYESLPGKPCAASETRKVERESPPFLFDLTTLQREANRRFGYSARRTLQAAQRLYESHKVLTYPRTDSKHLPEDYVGHVKNVLSTFSSGSQYAPYAQQVLDQGVLRNKGRIFDNSKISDHFAIIPTGKMPKDLRDDDQRIFDLVMRRFLAAFYPPAEWNKVERFTLVGQESFRVRSRTLQVPGWYEVYGSGENAEMKLPPLQPDNDQAKGIPVQSQQFDMKSDVTKPPPRINEGRLLGMMERAGKELENEELSEAMKDKGLGTPATRADIIENLISKAYIFRVKEGLKPSTKGIRLIDILHRIDSAGLASPELTGAWEKHLMEVERGQMARNEFMKGISEFTASVVEKIKGFQYEALYEKEPAVGKCPWNPDVDVVEFTWGYRCRDGSSNGDKCPHAGCQAPAPFIIWKEISGRYIDRGTVARLLENRRTESLPGFVDRGGKEYQAVLELDAENKVKVVGLRAAADGNGGESEAEPEETAMETLAKCPHGHDCEIVETSQRYVCRKVLEGVKSGRPDESCCSFALPKQVCKREITREEALEYIQNGRIGPYDNFVSKRGRNFSCTLVFNPAKGRHDFEFAERKPRRAPARKAPAKAVDGESAPSAKRSTAKKATARKPAVKKAATKSTAKAAVKTTRKRPTAKTVDSGD